MEAEPPVLSLTAPVTMLVAEPPTELELGMLVREEDAMTYV